MTFLSPFLLSGLALAAVPIIIHLLNRRRFIRVNWAPMEYLKLTLRKNRRRIQLEQWLLLAARVLAIAALFFAVARPTISDNGLVRLITAEGRTGRVIVLDDSLSMGAIAGGKSAFDRGKETVVELLKHVQPQDSLTVCTLTQPGSPLVRDIHLDQADRLSDLIRGLDVTHAFGHWATAFEKIDAYVQSASDSSREVVLVTDLRSAGWDTGVADVVDRWAAGHVGLRIIDVGEVVTGNVVLKSLEQTVPIALVRAPVGFSARIRNDSAESLGPQEATLAIDGKQQSLMLPELPAGKDVDVPLTVSFDTPGMHAVELQLPRDALPEDNVRNASVEVRSTLSVQVVDGEPDPRPFESETDFLELAYSVGPAPWQVTRMTDSQWASSPLGAPDVLVLANVGSISQSRADQLRAQVEAGLGLMIFLGEQVDPGAYNQILFREGRGILPAAITRFREDETAGLVIEGFADSPLAALARLKSQSLAKLRPKRFAEVSIPPDAGDAVRVLARWNDSRQSPAIVEKRIGEGRVLLWTITADRKWSDWPTDGSYVLAVRQAAMSIAAQTSERANVTAGQPLRERLEKKGIVSQAAVGVPGKQEPEVAAVDESDPKFPRLQYDKTLRTGFYRMTWKDPVLGDMSRLFAVSPDVRESDLAPIRTEDLLGLLGKLNPQIIRLGQTQVTAASSITELWRTVVWALLGLVVVESCLAAWVGRARGGPQESAFSRIRSSGGPPREVTSE